MKKILLAFIAFAVFDVNGMLNVTGRNGSAIRVHQPRRVPVVKNEPSYRVIAQRKYGIASSRNNDQESWPSLLSGSTRVLDYEEDQDDLSAKAVQAEISSLIRMEKTKDEFTPVNKMIYNNDMLYALSLVYNNLSKLNFYCFLLKKLGGQDILSMKCVMWFHPLLDVCVTVLWPTDIFRNELYKEKLVVNSLMLEDDKVYACNGLRNRDQKGPVVAFMRMFIDLFYEKAMNKNFGCKIDGGIFRGAKSRAFFKLDLAKD